MRQSLVLIGIIVLGTSAGCLYRSPGVLYDSSFAPLSGRQVALRDQLENDVRHLAGKIGPRNAGQDLRAVLAAERWIIERLSAEGVQAGRDEFDINGPKVANIVATFPGTRLPDEVVVIGAHYDTVANSPGADDNASGVALLLALAGYLTENPPERTVRVVFFVNEEWPFSGGIQMGSRVYAQRCKARLDHIGKYPYHENWNRAWLWFAELAPSLPSSAFQEVRDNARLQTRTRLASSPPPPPHPRRDRRAGVRCRRQ